jgi:hypothetical protein
MMPPLSPLVPIRRELSGRGQKQSVRLSGTSQGAASKAKQVSDQANNLRQLVRAHRQWRGLIEQPVLEPIARKGPFMNDEECRQDRRETSPAGFAAFVARTLESARAWRMRKAGGKKGDPA